jgi:hypothetical protein
LLAICATERRSRRPCPLGALQHHASTIGPREKTALIGPLWRGWDAFDRFGALPVHAPLPRVNPWLAHPNLVRALSQSFQRRPRGNSGSQNIRTSHRHQCGCETFSTAGSPGSGLGEKIGESCFTGSWSLYRGRIRQQSNSGSMRLSAEGETAGFTVISRGTTGIF